MDHIEHGEVSPDQDDPCPAMQVPRKTYSAHDQPLEVKLAITVNSISDIRLDESIFTAAKMTQTVTRSYWQNAFIHL